jgi:hypothetical protein
MLVPLNKYKIAHQLTTFQIQDDSATILIEPPRYAKRRKRSLFGDASDNWGSLPTNVTMSEAQNTTVLADDEDPEWLRFISDGPDWSPLQQPVVNINDNTSPDTSKRPKSNSEVSGSVPFDGGSLPKCIRRGCEKVLTAQDGTNPKTLTPYKYCKEHSVEIKQKVSS